MKTAHSVSVPTSVGRTFTFLSHTQNELQWRGSVEASRYLGANSPGVGVHGKTVAGPHSVAVHWVITNFEPGASLSWKLDGDPWSGGGTYVVTADERGSRVRASVVIRLKGIARLAEPILWVRSRRELREDLRRLADVLGDVRASIAPSPPRGVLGADAS